MIAAIILAVLLSAALTVDTLKGYGLKGDEGTYTAGALSLAYDGDLTFERKDLERYWTFFAQGPDGIFLQKASRRMAAHRLVPVRPVHDLREPAGRQALLRQGVHLRPLRRSLRSRVRYQRLPRLQRPDAGARGLVRLPLPSRAIGLGPLRGRLHAGVPGYLDRPRIRAVHDAGDLQPGRGFLRLLPLALQGSGAAAGARFPVDAVPVRSGQRHPGGSARRHGDFLQAALHRPDRADRRVATVEAALRPRHGCPARLLAWSLPAWSRRTPRSPASGTTREATARSSTTRTSCSRRRR